MSRGGKRPGAGRPAGQAAPIVTVSIRLDAETHALLGSLAVRYRARSQSAVVALALEAMAKHGVDRL